MWQQCRATVCFCCRARTWQQGSQRSNWSGCWTFTRRAHLLWCKGSSSTLSLWHRRFLEQLLEPSWVIYCREKRQTNRETWKMEGEEEGKLLPLLQHWKKALMRTHSQLNLRDSLKRKPIRKNKSYFDLRNVAVRERESTGFSNMLPNASEHTVFLQHHL